MPATQKSQPQTAESMAQKQREISVSEFFLKNRHLLGFDNPRKALLTTVKEAVDNALDACEEGGILPEISVDIRQTGENRFSVAVTDNWPPLAESSTFARIGIVCRRSTTPITACSGPRIVSRFAMIFIVALP